MSSKFHGGSKNRDKMLMKQYIRYVAPHMMASFALTLYERTNIPLDDIKELCIAIDELWNRSIAEGWDIIANCRELTGLDMRSYIDYKREAGDE